MEDALLSVLAYASAGVVTQLAIWRSTRADLAALFRWAAHASVALEIEPPRRAKGKHL